MKLKKTAQLWILTMVVIISLVATSGLALAQAVAPSLGDANEFAVLGASTVTNTGPTVVTGDLGLYAGTSITGFFGTVDNEGPGTVIGNIHQTDAVAMTAQDDVVTAYNALAIQPCDANYSGSDLGGMVLSPGVYCFDSSAQLTGALTLDMQGDSNSVFVFKIGSALTTASNSSVMEINSGSDPACNVFWQVGTSATLGTYSTFIGSILAMESISINTGAALTGRALARTGAVTLDTNAIEISICAGTPPALGALQIFKFNDLNGNGVYELGLGESPLSGWEFTTTGTAGYSNISTTGTSGFISLPGLQPGDYSVLETLPPPAVPGTWTVTTANPQTGVVTDGNITRLNFGNRQDDAPPIGHISVFKYDDIDHDGNYDAGDPGEPPLSGWQFCINGVCRITDATGIASWEIVPGSYTICETTRLGWVNSDPGGASCKPITLTGTQSEIVYFGNYEGVLPPPDDDDDDGPDYYTSGPTVGGNIMLVNKFELFMQCLSLPIRLMMIFTF